MLSAHDVPKPWGTRLHMQGRVRGLRGLGPIYLKVNNHCFTCVARSSSHIVISKLPLLLGKRTAPKWLKVLCWMISYERSTGTNKKIVTHKGSNETYSKSRSSALHFCRYRRGKSAPLFSYGRHRSGRFGSSTATISRYKAGGGEQYYLSTHPLPPIQTGSPLRRPKLPAAAEQHIGLRK